jgi:hypothetical protein
VIKLLLTRLFPIGGAVFIFGSALSPVKPTLNMFAAAANALAGETEQDVDVKGLEPADSPRKEMPRANKRKKLEALADQLGQSDEDTFGWKPGDRAAKPLAPPPKPKK